MDYLHLPESIEAYFQYWWWNCLILSNNLNTFTNLYFHPLFNGLCLYKRSRAAWRWRIWRIMGCHLWIFKFEKKVCFVLPGLLFYTKNWLLYHIIFYLVTSFTDHSTVLLKRILHDLFSLCQTLHHKTWQLSWTI